MKLKTTGINNLLCITATHQMGDRIESAIVVCDLAGKVGEQIHTAVKMAEHAARQKVLELFRQKTNEPMAVNKRAAIDGFVAKRIKEISEAGAVDSFNDVCMSIKLFGDEQNIDKADRRDYIAKPIIKAHYTRAIQLAGIAEVEQLAKEIESVRLGKIIGQQFAQEILTEIRDAQAKHEVGY